MSFFGDRLCKCRESKGIRRQELANLLGISRNTLSLWERGLYMPRSMVLVQQLADILQVPVTYFYQSWSMDEELRHSHVIQNLESRVSRLEHSFGEDAPCADDKEQEMDSEGGASDVSAGDV